MSRSTYLESSGLPQVRYVRLAAGSGILLVIRLSPKSFISVNYCGRRCPKDWCWRHLIALRTKLRSILLMNASVTHNMTGGLIGSLSQQQGGSPNHQCFQISQYIRDAFQSSERIGAMCFYYGGAYYRVWRTRLMPKILSLCRTHTSSSGLLHGSLTTQPVSALSGRPDVAASSKKISLKAQSYHRSSQRSSFTVFMTALIT